MPRKREAVHSTADSNHEVRNAPAVQIAHHARVGDQAIRQHHQIHGGVRHRGMRLAALGNAGPGAAQRLDEQLLQRPAAGNRQSLGQEIKVWDRHFDRGAMRCGSAHTCRAAHPTVLARVRSSS
jgi:hypothetical protein